VPPDFLNSREDAILAWLLVILGFVLYKDFRGISRALFAVVRSLASPKLLVLFGSALVYSALVVYGAHRLGAWHTTALKATIYWFVGSAVFFVGQAVTDGARDDRGYLRSVLRRGFALTIITEFIVNVYALPLAAELAVTLLVLLFVGMQVVAEHDPATPALTRKVIDRVLVAIGVLYLGYFAIKVAADFHAFLTREHAEDFLVGPGLTLTLIPFLLTAAWVSRREQKIPRRTFQPGFDSRSQ